MSDRTPIVAVHADGEAIYGYRDEVNVHNNCPLLTLSLDEDGHAEIVASTRYVHSVGATPDVVEGRAHEWEAPRMAGDLARVDMAALERFALDVEPLLARVHAGHVIERCDGRRVGRLTDDAVAASRRVERTFRVAADRIWITPSGGEPFAQGMAPPTPPAPLYA